MTPPVIARPEAVAIHALSTGTADQMQQRLALACIRQKLCLEAQGSYVQGDPTATAYNEGRRAVGIGIRAVINADFKDFPEVDHGR